MDIPNLDIANSNVPSNGRIILDKDNKESPQKISSSKKKINKVTKYLRRTSNFYYILYITLILQIQV